MGHLPFIDNVDEVFEWTSMARKFLGLPSGCVYLWELCILFSCFGKGNVRHAEDEDEDSPLRDAFQRQLLQLEAVRQHYI
jgi:hypothetical protein